MKLCWKYSKMDKPNGQIGRAHDRLTSPMPSPIGILHVICMYFIVKPLYISIKHFLNQPFERQLLLDARMDGCRTDGLLVPCICPTSTHQRDTCRLSYALTDENFQGYQNNFTPSVLRKLKHTITCYNKATVALRGLTGN
jgi:hypothetical protein